MGFKEAYAATGDKKYLTALSRAVKSIFETDVHNTGGFSTHERAIGTPYENGTIETCCVVAFDALVLELYKLTGEPSLIFWTAHIIMPRWERFLRRARGPRTIRPWKEKSLPIFTAAIFRAVPADPC